MKTIEVELTKNRIQFKGKCKNDWGFERQFDSFEIKSTSNGRVYLTVIKDSIRLLEIAKKMMFEDGIAFVKFGKEKVNIGTYNEVEVAC